MDDLQKMLEDMFMKYNFEIVVEKFNDGNALIDCIEKYRKNFDIIFLDVMMPAINGFPVADRLRKIHWDSILIFITYFAGMATEGYKYAAFRYILKENLISDLDEAVNAIMRQMKDKLIENRRTKLRCKNGNEYEILEVLEKEILYLHKNNNRRVYLRATHGEYELLQYTLAKYKEIIASDCFLIVSRVHLVNLAHVIDIKGDYFQLSNKEALCIGFKRETKTKVKLQYAQYRRERM